MKRLIVLSLLFTMVVSAVFTQVSGLVDNRMYLLDAYFPEEGENELYDEYGSPMHIYGLISAANLTLTGTSEDRQFGGQFRVTVEYDTRENTLNWPWHKAYVWWQPIPQFRLFLGQDPDGQFENAVLAGYEFHQGNEQYIGVMLWDFWRAVFPGNWDTFGMAFTYRPIRELQFNLVIPTGGPEVLNWPRYTKEHVQRKVAWQNMFPWGLRLTANAQIPDIGSVLFSYIGPEHFKDDALGIIPLDYSGEDPERVYNHYGDIGLSFLLKGPVPGLQVQLGGAVKIPAFSDLETYPVMLGLAAHYQTNLFGYDCGVKFRYGVSIHTLYDRGSSNFAMSPGEDIFLHGNIMPWIDISGWKIHLDLGMTGVANPDTLAGSKIPDVTEDDKFIMGWWIGPYVKFRNFEAGVIVMTAGDDKHFNSEKTAINDNMGWGIHKVAKDARIKLSIPIRMVFHF